MACHRHNSISFKEKVYTQTNKNRGDHSARISEDVHPLFLHYDPRGISVLFPPLQLVEWLKNETLERQRAAPPTGRFMRDSTRGTHRNLVDVRRSNEEEEAAIDHHEKRFVLDLCFLVNGPVVFNWENSQLERRENVKSKGGPLSASRDKGNRQGKERKGTWVYAAYCCINCAAPRVLERNSCVMSGRMGKALS